MRQLFVNDGEGSHIYFFNQNIFLSEKIGREQYKVCYTCLKRKGKYIFSLYTNKDSLLVSSISERNRRNQKHYLPLGKRTGWVEDEWGAYLLLILYSMYTMCTYFLLKNWNKQREGKWGDQSGSCDNSPWKRDWAKMMKVEKSRQFKISFCFFVFWEKIHRIANKVSVGDKGKRRLKGESQVFVKQQDEWKSWLCKLVLCGLLSLTA